MDIADISSVSYWVRFWNNYGDNIIAAVAKVAVILIAYFILRLILSKLTNRLIAFPFSKVNSNILPGRQARLRALQTVLKSTIGFVLGFVVIIMLLEAVGIPIVPLITTAGVAGLAIGFGAQKLVRDVIAGFFILMEDQYGVGDYVTIGVATGIVEDLGMRTTRIIDKFGKLYILSNGDITQVCNLSREELRMCLDIALPASTDLEKAKRVLDRVGATIAKDYPSQVNKAFISDGLTQISSASVTVRLVGSVVAQHQEDIQTKIYEKILEAFQENDLQLA